MALTLLDYLFDRETQATHNLSGTGKHGKRQLDPLMVYGIRCKYENVWLLLFGVLLFGVLFITLCAMEGPTST